MPISPSAVEGLKDREERPLTVAAKGRRARRLHVPSAAVPAAIALAGTVLAFFRVPPVSAGTIWAEDGRVFLQEYLEQGPGLLAPYDGYLHFLPRLIVADRKSVV